MLTRVIFITLFLQSNLFAIGEFHSIRYDHLLHFSISSMGAVCISQWEKSMLEIKEDYGIFSVGVPLFAGIIKEVSDTRGRYFKKENYMDLLAGVTGAIFGKLLTYTF